MGEIEEAIEIVQAFIDGRYKSIYLMDSWIKIKMHLEEEIREKKNNS